MIYVISTMSNDNVYAIYEKREDVNVVAKSILIKGGANVQDKRILQVSSVGVTTPITEEDYNLLKDNPVFKLHQDKGFIKVVQSNESEAKKKAEKMDTKDKSAQLTPQDFKNRGFKNVPEVDVDKITTGK